MFWVYILENPNGKFYVGQSDDLERRIFQHNNPLAQSEKYTHKNGPWKLVWSEEHPTRSSSMAREKQIKSMKSARWIREKLLHRKSESRRAGINR